MRKLKPRKEKYLIKIIANDTVDSQTRGLSTSMWKTRGKEEDGKYNWVTFMYQALYKVLSLVFSQRYTVKHFTIWTLEWLSNLAKIIAKKWQCLDSDVSLFDFKARVFLSLYYIPWHLFILESTYWAADVILGIRVTRKCKIQ